MGQKIFKFPICYLALLVFALAGVVFGQTSGSLTGTVLDPQGAAVPGAAVKAINSRTGLAVESITSGEGVFSFPALQPSNYTLEIELAGFKKLIKTGVIIETAVKTSLGNISLEVGGITETVSVSADSAQMQLKSTSGEQAATVTTRQIQELALNGRNLFDMMKLIPGVRSSFDGTVAGPGGTGNFNINGTRGTMHNVTIDGATNVDTGSNTTQHVMMNVDAVAEFSVFVSNYQAEFGRSAGGDVRILTRGGENRYHGTGYIFHRHEGLNANSFSNNANGLKADGSLLNPRNLYRYNYFGYNVGGPIPIGGFLKGKLFFFGGQEFHRQLVPTSAQQVRVPTALEAGGDFSKTVDGNGTAIVVKDPTTGLQFPGNVIPKTRLNPDGLAILKLFNKYENAASSLPRFNHNSQQSVSYPRRQENIRIDYQVTASTHIFGRFTQDTDQQIMPYGLGWTTGQNFPLTPTIFKQGPARNAALNITTNISPTLVNEFIFGPSQNNLTLNTEDPNAGTMSGIGLTFKPPFAYNSAQFINIGFGGTPSQTFAGINNYDKFPYKNSNTTFDFTNNLSKVFNRHVVKAGIFVQRSRKDQSAGNSMNIQFSHNTSNPNNTGHPYSNALIGEFNSLYEPTTGIYQGQYRSTSVEWFVQDNWRFSKRLTFDYGLRMYIVGPQYDARNQDSYFDPSKWDPTKAVRLYRQVGSGSSAKAYDPANPSVLLPSYLVQRIVPGSGDAFNGMQSTANGYMRGGIKNRGIQWGPRFGFAYDVFGNTKTILRGGYGIFYDRLSGNALIFPAVEMPPRFVAPTFNWGNLATVGNASTGGIALGTVSPLGSDPEGQIPNVHNFSLQIQHDVGFDTVISIGYVGSLGRHMQTVRNLNYIPLGTYFLKSSQDPTLFTGGVVPDADSSIPQVYKDAGLKFDGTKKLNDVFLRRYPGYGSINYREYVGTSNYSSLQATVNRKFSRNFTFNMAYTWSKSMGTSGADGDTVNPIDRRGYNYGVLGFDRKHTLAISYVYNLPKLSPKLGNHWLAKGVFDDWEVSGISQFSTGGPVTPGCGWLPSNSRSITGSGDFGGRCEVTGDPRLESGRTNWFDITKFRLPDIGSKGTGAINTLRNPGTHVHDISVFKNFSLGGDSSRRIQIRVEMFNAFNHPQFGGFSSGLTWQLASDWSDYKTKQQAAPAYINNVRGGGYPPVASGDRLGRAVGEFSGGGTPRIIQLAAKIYF